MSSMLFTWLIGFSMVCLAVVLWSIPAYVIGLVHDSLLGMPANFGHRMQVGCVVIFFTILASAVCYMVGLSVQR